MADEVTTPGMLESGNIDLYNRPKVQNDDGSISTVRSMSFNDGQHEVLVPTVVGDRVVSDQEAIDHYRKTGQHLGKFDTPENATAYAKQLHSQQEELYVGNATQDTSQDTPPSDDSINADLNNPAVVAGMGPFRALHDKVREFGAKVVDEAMDAAKLFPGMGEVAGRGAYMGGQIAKSGVESAGSILKSLDGIARVVADSTGTDRAQVLDGLISASDDWAKHLASQGVQYSDVLTDTVAGIMSMVPGIVQFETDVAGGGFLRGYGEARAAGQGVGDAILGGATEQAKALIMKRIFKAGQAVEGWKGALLSGGLFTAQNLAEQAGAQIKETGGFDPSQIDINRVAQAFGVGLGMHAVSSPDGAPGVERMPLPKNVDAWFRGPNVYEAYTALRDGTTDPAVYRFVEIMAETHPEFDQATSLKILNEIRQASDDIMRSEGFAPGTEGVIAGEMIPEQAGAEGFRAAINLYFNHDLSTMIEEVSHVFIDPLSGPAKAALREVYDKTEATKENPRIFREYAAQEAIKYYVDSDLWSRDPSNEFEVAVKKIGDTVRSLAQEVSKVEGNQVGPAISNLYAVASSEGQWRQIAGMAINPPEMVGGAEYAMAAQARRRSMETGWLEGSPDAAGGGNGPADATQSGPMRTRPGVGAGASENKIGTPGADVNASYQVKPVDTPRLDAQIENVWSWEKIGNETRPWEIVEKTDPMRESLVKSDLPAGFEKYAVNVNLDRLKTGDDIKALINQVGETLRPEMEQARRYVQTDSMVERNARKLLDEGAKGLAEDLGMSEATLLQRQRGEAFNAEQALAARMILVNSAEDLMGLAKAIRAGDNSDKTLLEFRRRIEAHSAIQMQVSGMAAEAGRALRSFRILAGGYEIAPDLQAGPGDLKNLQMLVDKAGGRGNLQDLAEAMADLSVAGAIEPHQINVAIDQARNRTWWDWVIGFRYHAMLSGIPTHLRNNVGNLAVVTMSLPERWVAEKIGTISQSIGLDRVAPGEDVLREGWDLKYSQGRKAWQLKNPSGEVITEIRGAMGRDEAMNTLRKDSEAKAQEWLTDPAHVAQGETMALLKGYLDSQVDAFKTAWWALKTGESQFGGTKVEQNMASGGVPVGWFEKTADMLWDVMNIPGKALAAEDEYFKVVNYRGELGAQAVRRAQAEGLEGQALADRVQELINKPSDEMLLASIDAAKNRTFNDDLTGWQRSIQHLSQYPVMKVIVPFVRVPINIFNYSMERTPFAPLMSSFRSDIAAGGARRDLALSKMIVGSSMFAIAGAMANAGLITGGGPANKGEREAWLMNFQPYSFKIGDKWISYGNIADPLGNFFGMASDAHDVITDWRAGNISTTSMAVQLVLGMSKNFLSKTFLRGFSDALQAINDPKVAGERWLTSTVTSFVPANLRYAAQAESPEAKITWNILDAVKAKIPGWGDEMAVKRNLWGDPVIPNELAGWGYFVSPITIKEDKASDVEREMLRLRMSEKAPDKMVTMDGVAVELTPAQYSRWLQITGQEHTERFQGRPLELKDYLQAMVDSAVYQRAVMKSDGPEGDGARMIKQAISDFREAAKYQLFREYPELYDQVEQGQARRAEGLRARAR